LEISSTHTPDKNHEYLTDIYTPCSYENIFVKKIIRNFKYNPFYKEFDNSLANLIASHFFLIEQSPPLASIIIPVPLFSSRIRWRGYNQSALIAAKISKIWNIAVLNSCLARIKKTESQTNLSKESRLQNVKNAFVCSNKSLIKDKQILLVDDIVTSGATMNECARTLIDYGASSITGIAVARAKT
jgi:ComF family protein